VSTTKAPVPYAAPAGPSTLTIVGHSDLFYWWPVWAAGFLMALLTYVGGHHMAVVPAGTVADKGKQVEGYEGPRDVLVAPAQQALPADAATGALLQPRLHVAVSNSLGSVFVTVLLLVILITNVRLSGVWSLVAILVVLFLSVVFALAGVWDTILHTVSASDVHVTAAGYLCIALPLFVVWLAVFLFYDRLNYVTFSRGQFTMHHFLGGGATTYEVLGLSLEKKRNDLFRHWLLGIGSGDLVIRTGGVNAQTFNLPNVLFVDSKLVAAKRLLQEREVVKA
jgi:hypothetical protein